MWRASGSRCCLAYLAAIVCLGGLGAFGPNGTPAFAETSATAAEVQTPEAVRDSLRLEIRRYSELIRTLRDSLAEAERSQAVDERWLTEAESAVNALGEAIGMITDQLAQVEIEIDAGRFSLRDGRGGHVTLSLPPDLGDKLSQGLTSITRMILEEIPDTLRILDGAAGQARSWFDRNSGSFFTTRPAERLIQGDIVKLNDDLHIAPNEVIAGDVIAIFGDVVVEGKIRGDLIVILGAVKLEAEAVVEGQVVQVFGRFEREDGARTGSLTLIHPGDVKALRGFSWPWAVGTGFLAWQAMFVMMLSLVLLVLALAPRQRLDQLCVLLDQRPLPSLLLGLLLVLPGHVAVIGLGAILVMTVIGIPIAVLAVLALALLDLAAIGITAVTLGRRLCARLGLGCHNRLQAALLGLLVLHAPAFLAALGAAAGLPVLFVAMLAWAGRVVKIAALAAGVGAMLLGRLGAARRSSASAVC